MRMRFWILLSLVLHLTVAIAFSFRFTAREKPYVNLAYLTVTHVQERTPQQPHQTVPRREGDITPSDQPVQETNLPSPPPASPERQFLPFYLVDELPVPLTRISPEYPEEARRLGIEGAVVARVYIDEQGNPERVEIVKSPHPLLSDAVEKTLQHARFSPAKSHQKPVAVIFELTLRFRLK